MFRYGIEVEGFSSDADSRLLSAMLEHTPISNGNTEAEDKALAGICFTQGTVHIGTKWRIRLLSASILLPIGKALISISHLKQLINNVEKAEHGIVMKDICPDDRQNYASLEKIMQPRVLDSLSKHVVGSDGTVMYLKLCEKITSSMTAEDLSPLERIYKIWYATYFLRIWRKWLEKSERYTIQNNFVTRPAYASVEINATNLVLLTKKFRDKNIENLYLSILFNSQPCEEIFRQFRSMGTLNYTKINFTLLELFHLVGRVELENEIVYMNLADTNILFPRNKINKAKLNQFKLPSDTEISDTLNQAKKSAIEDAEKFGMIIESNEIKTCELIIKKNLHYEDEIHESDCEKERFNDLEHNDKKSSFIDITLKDGTQKTEQN